MLDSQRTRRRARRKTRVRRKVWGNDERPRLSVYKSLKHIYAQVVSDKRGATLAFASTVSKELRGKLSNTKNKDAARQVGILLARLCKEKNITNVVFDRGGFLYHGRVQALAEAAREGGLVF
jgi:large subunit ribosomal protein L18